MHLPLKSAPSRKAQSKTRYNAVSLKTHKILSQPCSCEQSWRTQSHLVVIQNDLYMRLESISSFPARSHIKFLNTRNSHTSKPVRQTISAPRRVPRSDIEQDEPFHRVPLSA